MKTVTVELKNENVLRQLKDLELADIIKIIKGNTNKNSPSGLRGSITIERAKELNQELDKMRNEWEQRNF